MTFAPCLPILMLTATTLAATTLTATTLTAAPESGSATRPDPATLREEHFDREPAGWEAVNARSSHFERRPVTQNFGYSPATNHAGGQPGEVGGTLNPSGEPAYYGYRLPKPLTFDDLITASGKLFVAIGPGNCLLGFFNANTLNEWRTPNTLVARINGRGDVFHAHAEYCTSRWRADAGVIGEIVPGQRVSATNNPSGKTYDWKLQYDPAGPDGSGLCTFILGGVTARWSIPREHRADKAVFTHFGLVALVKTWDSPGEVWIDDVSINGEPSGFDQDPKWDELGNRRTYLTADVRPRFDFGWSPTQYAGGTGIGELGGLIFRGDCREPQRMACYGDRLSPLTLKHPLFARGKMAMIRGVTDSTASIGFYHSKWSMQSNPSQAQGTPIDYLGMNIEGPSSEGFFCYPLYRLHGGEHQTLRPEPGKAPRIYPDRQVHDWLLAYDPQGAGGKGRITVGLDGQPCTLDLAPGHQELGAGFDRFGICTPWIDGNSVTVYFDDIRYTYRP